MRNRISACVFFAVVLASTSALAQEEYDSSGPSGIGVGAEATITGVGGLAVIYDAGPFHIDGLLGFDSNNANMADDRLLIGARFLWELHESQGADFSIGGGVSFVNTDFEGNRDSELDTHIELIGQIRAFVVPSVALSASFGAGTVIRDGEDVLLIDGQLVGAIGVAYYFF
jgi:hypothetical protein